MTLNHRLPISVTILTKDSERLINEVLSAVEWCDEVVVLDTGSQDHTLEIAGSFSNVKIYHEPFSSFGPLHNKMAELATHDWILSIDSDEIVTPKLAEEISELTLDPNAVYSVSRYNFLNGRRIFGCGWTPDRVVRLYNRKKTRFSTDRVHEKVLTERHSIVQLRHPLHHYSYHSVDDFLTKMKHYSTLFAEQYCHRKKGSLWKALVHSAWAFIKTYFIQYGIIDGSAGYMISRYQAQTAYYKYLKLRELQLAQNTPMAGGEGQGIEIS